ncbi:hypothetical protein PFFCH_01236 [Plasmodium falciparum FCH/4]|uniref:Uncharacterized protein n=1 Tax=Plasmodium falciparum FCH/4 TaxID=1036724 RepID=A0A024VTX9_PLAFA|nr:hypothetical protein PFFCH_01236 [Plasmodium falciparum FCH/4]
MYNLYNNDENETNNQNLFYHYIGRIIDREIKNPKILLLNAERKIKYDVLESYFNHNYNYTYLFWKNLSNKNINIILVYGELDYYIKKLLLSKKIYFFTSIKKKNMSRLSNLLCKNILSYENIKNFDVSYIARANYFKIQKYKKNVKNIFLCCNNKFLTICIFGKQDIRDDNITSEMLKKRKGNKNECYVYSYDENNSYDNTCLINERNRYDYLESMHNNVDVLLKKEIEKENILDNFINVYYKNKKDDYIIDYYFVNKEKKINLYEKDTSIQQNKKWVLINHLKNIVIIKKKYKKIYKCI